jgi:hypothetical protein
MYRVPRNRRGTASRRSHRPAQKHSLLEIFDDSTASVNTLTGWNSGCSIPAAPVGPKDPPEDDRDGGTPQSCGVRSLDSVRRSRHGFRSCRSCRACCSCGPVLSFWVDSRVGSQTNLSLAAELVGTAPEFLVGKHVEICRHFPFRVESGQTRQEIAGHSQQCCSANVIALPMPHCVS